MEFGQLVNIIWLIALLLVVALSVRVYQWRVKTKDKFADSALQQYIFPVQTKNYFWTKTTLISIVILLLIFSLMDPLLGKEEIKVKREGIDIVYALDLSASMNAQDTPPNRLERAKKIITESISQLAGDRVGLIIFASDAYIISPLTNDYGAILNYISSAQTQLISRQGTDYKNVLEKASESLKETPNTSKLLVLISDGEEHENNTNQAIELAKENNINIITIGIGTSSGAPIPTVEYGNIVDYKQDKNGETVISKLDDKTLKKIARETKGEYIYAENTQQTKKELFEGMLSLQKSEQETTTMANKKHIFQWFLAIAILLLFIDSLTPEHKLFNTKKS